MQTRSERDGCAKAWICKHGACNVCVQRHGCASTVHANTWGCKSVAVQRRGCANTVCREAWACQRGHVCVCTRGCACAQLCAQMHACARTHTRVSAGVHTAWERANTGLRTRGCTEEQVWMHACVCAHMPGCVRVPHTRVHRCARRNACAGACACAGAHGQARTDARACVDTQMCTDVPADTRVCAHVNQPWGCAPPTPMRYQQLKISPTAASSHRHGNGRMGSGAGGGWRPLSTPTHCPQPPLRSGGLRGPLIPR